MMTPDDIIAVVQAYKDGKAIEFVREVGNEWVIAPYPCWDFSIYTYRVKPEMTKPREFWLVTGPDDGVQRVYQCQQIRSRTGLPLPNQIHVREVLE